MSRPRGNHFFSGYLFVEIRGAGLHDVLLALHKQGVTLYDVEVKAERCTCGVGLNDFDGFYRACRQHHVKIRFLRREGMPVLLKTAKRRKAFVFGGGLFVAIVYLLGSIVWQVNVSGVEDETKQEILQAAKELGIYTGAWKHSLGSHEQMQSALLKKLPDLMWVGVQVEGSKVNVEAVENVPGTNLVQSQPHNISAGKPGVIRKVFANRGTVVVKPGQVVHPGEVLISGSLGQGAKEVPAEGEVYAEVWYRSTISLPLHVAQSALTGSHVNRDYLHLWNFNLRVWGFKQPDYQASVERENSTSWKLGHWELPIQWKEVTLYEVTPQKLEQSEADAQRQALALAAQDVRSQMHKDGQIIGQQVLHREVQNGKLYATILTRTEEDIGVPAGIPQPSQHSD